MELHDRRTYYRAFQSHDARFDGRVFVGVTSTGIYCRPICPARCPKFENCRFFASAAGAQEGEDSDVETLAERLGVGGRQLRRLFQRHLGASPIAVAQTRRVLFAKQLLHGTHLPMTEVALASGFGSVRRFNATFHDLFGRPPSALRRKGGVDNSAHEGVTLRLAYRPPYDWPGMLAALSSRATSTATSRATPSSRR